MRSGIKFGIAAFGAALVLGACTSNTVQSPATSATTTDSGSPAPAEPVAAVEMTELVALARENVIGIPGEWHVNGSRSAAVYELRTAHGYEVWGVDGRGEPWLIASTGTIERIHVAGDDRIAITDKDETKDEYRIRYARLDAAEVLDVATSRSEVRVVGLSGDHLVYAAAGDQTVELLAWTVASGEARKIGSYADEFPNLAAPVIVGDHIVYEVSSGESRHLVAMRVTSGETIDVPHREPVFRQRFVGEAPNGHAVLAAHRHRGGSIHTVDLEHPDRMTDLTDSAVPETAFLDGTMVRFVDTDGAGRQIDLVTGEVTAAPDRRGDPPGPVTGLEEGHVRLQAELDNGNWLITGWLVDGAEYRALWQFNEQFGGATADQDVFARGLYEYDPATRELWQVSGPPTISATTTSSGSGESPNGVLRVEVLEGFIVFSTGFSGAAYDIEYNLYASPIPSTLES